MKKFPRKSITKSVPREPTAAELRLAEKKKQARKEQKILDEAQRAVFVKWLWEEHGLKCIPEYRFHPKRLWRIDFYFEGRVKVGLEVEGGVYIVGRHTSPQGFLNDIIKYNALSEHGIYLVRTTPKDLDIYKLYIEAELLRLLKKLLL